MNVTFEQAHAYFTVRLSEPRLPSRSTIMHRCPFHNDRTESLSINLDKGGVWKCHACNIGGGLFEFEKQMFGSGRDNAELWDRIYKLTGIVPPERNGGRELGPVVATYRYTDADGNLLFEKRRHEPKTFTQRAPRDNGAWTYTLAGVRKVLYNLPSVTTARIVLICEGEKDCDRLSAALGGAIEVKPGITVPVATTCNFDGAGKWRDEYSVSFANRRIVIFADNDDPGRQHAEQVARSVVKYATSVKIVALPDLPEKGDVSDYLEAHTVQDLLAEIAKAPRFKEDTPEKPASPFFVAPSCILPHGAPSMEWFVPGVAQRGGKGMIVASPKAGKSMLALDLAVALSTGQEWLGFAIPQQARVAVLSREDNASMTMLRLQQFARGRELDFANLSHLHVNTFQQRARFAIDNDEDLAQLIETVKAFAIELVIFDVLNKLHASDENSNTEMTKLMARFDRVRFEAGCDVAVIHHDAKGSAPGQRKPRGASAIDSWWDWRVSIDIDPENDSLKHVHFATKASSPHPEVTVQFQTHPALGNKIVRVA